MLFIVMFEVLHECSKGFCVHVSSRFHVEDFVYWRIVTQLDAALDVQPCQVNA